MRYLLGVDVGGSKTHALVADETGCAVGFGTAGQGNYQGVGYTGFLSSVRGATGSALARAGIRIEEVAGAGFGIGGYDWPSQLERHQSAIGGLGLNCPVEIVNDTIIGLVAGASEGWGVVVVGGTGCNSRGRDRQGREGRVTGEGERFGEWGGGVELVAHAVRAVSHDWCKRGPHTRLSELFLELTGARDLDDLIEGLDLGRYRTSAGWTRQIFRVAYEGDTVARDIVIWAGQELGELACAVIRQLRLQDEALEIIQIGGLFDGGPLYADAFHQVVLQLAPRAKFIRLAVPPVVGGVLLAAGAAGFDTRSIRNTLVQTTGDLLRDAR